MLSKSKSQWLCLLLVVGCAGAEGEIQGTDEAELISETAKWGFEGSTQGWRSSGSVLVASLSSLKPYAGRQSLALRFTGGSGVQQVSVGSPPKSSTVTFRLWVPWGAKVASVQAFGLEDKSWRWHSTYVSGSALMQNAWNTVRLNVPATAGALASLGLEIDARSGWRGTMYLDSVALASSSTPVAVVDAGTPTPPPVVVVDAGTPTPPPPVIVVDAGTPTPPPVVVVDAGTPTPPPPGVVDAGTPPPPVVSGAVHVQGNRLLKADGTPWKGRGANLNDMRSCNACTAGPPSVAEVKRRVDELVNVWKANFIRLDLEAYGSSDGYRNASNYQSVLYDPQYVADIRELVRYIGTKPGVQVLVSLWTDPSIDSMGRPTINPTIGTDAVWRKLTQALADQPHAMFGIVNEPQLNYDGAGDATVHSLMSQVVRAIRETEEASNVPYHVVTVQGTGGWARRLDYYVTHPITERGGANIAYEIHVYNPAADFVGLFENFAATLPIIIGEFGPLTGTMTQPDCTALMDRAQALGIPHLAWTFHMRCNPSLVVDTTGGGCGLGMPLTPTAWGNQLKARFATPW